MKRTKQRFDKPNVETEVDVSGCRQFEGEDRGYADRMSYNASTQKDWVNQQLREKQMMAYIERQEEEAYAEQTDTLNRMRGMLEDEMTQKRNQMMKQIQQEN